MCIDVNKQILKSNQHRMILYLRVISYITIESFKCCILSLIVILGSMNFCEIDFEQSKCHHSSRGLVFDDRYI